MIDEVKISIIGGKGGNGCVSFRREKYVPRGGPDGGNGGNGGNVYFVGDPSLNTLLHLSYAKTWRGENGKHGSGKNRSGANGKHVCINVPFGTLIHIYNGREGRDYYTLGDITTKEEVIVARGGNGGSGNSSFASAQQREPLIAELGEVGERADVLLELKLIADVGIIGAPNAGKSTLLSACSAARPKIADYAFTTLDPVLGVAEVYGNSFVLVEVPGLIEGAHMGVGLGHEFLKHAERVRVIWHLVDSSDEDPLMAFDTVGKELAMFSDTLVDKKRMVVINKVDIPYGRDKADTMSKMLSERGLGVYMISAATGEGLDTLLAETLTMVNSMPREAESGFAGHSSSGGHVGISKLPEHIVREGNEYVVKSPRLERIAGLANVKDQRVLDQLWSLLVKSGLDKQLVEQGIEPGDVVRLGRVQLEWK